MTRERHPRRVAKLSFVLDNGPLLSGRNFANLNAIRRNVANPPNRRVTVRRCIQTLMHACHCHDANCLLPSCRKMKRVIQHTNSCRRKANGGCLICRQLIALCCYHAKHCEEAECLVPYCTIIKSQLRQQRLQAQIHQAQNLAQNGYGGPNQQQLVPEMQQVMMQPVPGQMIGGPSQGLPNPRMGPQPQPPGQRPNQIPPALQQLLQTLKLPTSPQQQQQVLAILKSNPQLMAAFIKQRIAANQHHNQQQVQQQQQIMQQQQIQQGMPSGGGGMHVGMQGGNLAGNVQAGPMHGGMQAGMPGGMRPSLQGGLPKGMTPGMALGPMQQSAQQPMTPHQQQQHQYWVKQQQFLAMRQQQQHQQWHFQQPQRPRQSGQQQAPPRMQQGQQQQQVMMQTVPGQMIGGPSQGLPNPGMGPPPQLLGQRPNQIPPELQQLLQTLKSPTSPQQQQQVLAILKSNPQLMAAFIKQRTAANQHHYQQQVQQQQQIQQGMTSGGGGMQGGNRGIQGRNNPGMSSSPQSLDQRLNHFPPALQQLVETLKYPPSPQQDQQVLAILKSDPQLMEAFLKHSSNTANQHHN